MMETKLILDAVHVGHGDCTIISFNNGIEEKWWHCIIDAGNGLSEGNANILEIVKKRNIEKFDLAVLSHFDSDHIGGFYSICDCIPIEKYWSPYTPAIENNVWLFGEKGKTAVERAKKLERVLYSKGTILEAPVEGYSMSPTRGLKIKVFSPPIKLYRSFLENDERDIVNDFDALLGEMVEFEDNEDFDENIIWAVRSMYSRCNNGVISRDFENESREITHTSENSVINTIVPEFFGNNVLNNTSIVLKIEVWTGSKWYDLLFPGDLENWLYLMAVRADDIKSNYYKASHHGGRVYIDCNKEANDEVIQTIRPDIIMISANGKHDLPKGTARLAYERWVPNIFCTQKRKCELFSITGEIPLSNCCKQSFDCKQEGIATSFSLAKNMIHADTQSCVSRSIYSSYPIVQIEQHLIPDSKVLTALTEGEISKHIAWLIKELDKIHKERKFDKDISNSELLYIKEIKRLSLLNNRNLTEQQIKKIFEYGYGKDKLWMLNDSGYHNEIKGIYKKANETEINEMCEIVTKFDLLIFKVAKWQKGKNSNLINLSGEKLFELIERKTAFPSEIIQYFCWPKIVSKIDNKYTHIYLQEKYSSTPNDLLIMVKSSLSITYEEVIENLEIRNNYSYMSYSRDDKAYEMMINSIIDGDKELFVCSDINHRTKRNSEVINDLLYKVSNSQSNYTAKKIWNDL